MFNIIALSTICRPFHKAGQKVGILSVLLIASGICASARQSLANSIFLAPHRAVYDMTLERTAASSGITQLMGRLVYEITGDACKGYAQRTRFVTRSIDKSGKVTLMDSRSKFLEDAVGRALSFEIDHYQNDKLTEKAAGTAKRDDQTNAVSVQLSKPRRQNIDIDRSVLFPIQHTLRLLAAARLGKTVFSADLYDGSEEGAQIYETTAIIGNPNAGRQPEALKRVQNTEAFDGLQSWPISLSFFKPQAKRADALPTYELGFLFYENGVSRNLLIDYGYITIRGRLTALEMFAPSDCKNWGVVDSF